MVSTSPTRPSRFVEALPQINSSSSTVPETQTQPQSSEHFFSILTEMDEFESRQQNLRNRGASQSSFESLPSSSSSPTSTSSSSSAQNNIPDRSHTVKEGRRSINFTRSSLDKELAGEGSSSSRRRSGSGSDGEGHSSSGGETTGDKLARKFVGRLRALTAGGSGKEKDRDATRYAGT